MSDDHTATKNILAYTHMVRTPLVTILGHMRVRAGECKHTYARKLFRGW